MPDPLAEIFLKLDGINGESTAKGHQKEIDVFSYEQGIDLTAIHFAGGGGGAGKATFSGVRFRKNVDAASVPMLLACASGKHIKDARFTFRRSAGGFEFYKVVLEDVLITHMNQCGGTGAQYPLSFGALNAGDSSDGFLDDVTLDFRRIKWEHRRPGARGGPGGVIKGGWDLWAGKKV